MRVWATSDSCRKLANLVNDILDYSRMKYGDLLLDIRPVRVEGPIRTVVSVFSQLEKVRDLDIISEIPDALPNVLADENRLVQIRLQKAFKRKNQANKEKSYRSRHEYGAGIHQANRLLLYIDPEHR